MAAPESLAHAKPTRQSTEDCSSSSLAVNGIYTDFTHILANGTKWWIVNLTAKYSIGSIELNNRDGMSINNFFLLTSSTQSCATFCCNWNSIV